MTDKKYAIRVGMFAFVSATLVMLVLIVFAGFHFWRQRTRYYIEFPDSVMGLSNGVQVYFDGIEVGSVEDIHVAADDLGRVRVAIDVDKGTPIRTDTTALLSMAGITGLKMIDLRGGKVSTQALPPGSVIAAGQTGLDKLEQQAQTIADQSAAVIDKTKKIVDGVGEIVANLQQVTDPAQLTAIMKATRETSENMARATRDVDAMIADNRGALHETLVSISRSTEGANQLVGDLRSLVHSNQATIQATLSDLRQAARTFKDLAREVREKPSRLVFSGAVPDRKLP